MVHCDLHGGKVARGDALHQVGLVEPRAVDPHRAFATFDRFPGKADNAFDQILDRGVGEGRRTLEHDDVATPDVAGVQGDLVDEQAIIDLEGRHHRRRRDEEGLHHGGPHQQGDTQRQRENDDPLDHDRSAASLAAGASAKPWVAVEVCGPDRRGGRALGLDTGLVERGVGEGHGRRR